MYLKWKKFKKLFWNCMKGVNCELGVVPVWRFQDIWIDGLLTGRLKEVDWFKVQTHTYSSNKPPLWKYITRNDFKYIKWKIRRVCQFCCWNRGGKCWTNKIDRSFQFAKLINWNSLLEVHRRHDLLLTSHENKKAASVRFQN